MPFKLGAAGAGVVSGAISEVSNQVSGALNRRFAKKMYQKQRTDQVIDRDWQRSNDLADYDKTRKDSLSDWNMVNDYNSHKSQMARLKEAGLNPSLIYGNASSAEAASVNQPEMNRSDAGTRPSMEMDGHYNIGRGVETGWQVYQMVQSQELQKKAMELANQNKEAEAGLIRAQMFKALAEVDAKKLNTQLLRDTYDELIKGAKLNNDVKSANIASSTQSIAESKQRVLESVERVKKLKVDTQYTLDENQRKKISSQLQNKLTEEQTRKLAQEILTEVERTSLAKSQSQLTDAQKAKISQEIEMLKSQIAKMTSTEVREWLKVFIPD